MNKEKSFWERLGDLYNKLIGYLDKLGLVNKEDYQISTEPFINNQVVINPQVNLPKKYQWILAMAAPLGFQNGEVLNTFNSGITKGRTDHILSEYWGITNRDELMKQVESLYEFGHRSNYEFIVEYYNQYGLENAIVELKKESSDQEQLSKDIVELKRIDEARSLFIKDGLMTSQDKLPSFIAWDYGRIISLMRWSISSQLITADNFIKILDLIDLVTPVRTAYNSWEEYAYGYLFTRYIWSGDRDDHVHWKKNIDSLLNTKNSPWVTLDWNI